MALACRQMCVSAASVLDGPASMRLRLRAGADESLPGGGGCGGQERRDRDARGRVLADKIRACWEALAALRQQPERWWVWRPIDPSRPDAALRELPSIRPQPVRYPDGPGGATIRTVS